MTKTIDIIIISYNCRDHTLNCIKSIYETQDSLNFEIFVVDNASTDDTIERLHELYPEVRIVANSENLGYAGAVNAGAFIAEAAYLILSNADVIYQPGSIQNLIEYLEENPKCGAVGPQQLFPNEGWQNSYGELPGYFLGLKNVFFISPLSRILKKFYFKNGASSDIRNAGYIDGAVIACKKKIFDRIKGFDEDYFFYTEEADFCYRLNKAGYDIVSLPKARVIHLRGGASEGGGMSEKHIEMLIGSKGIFCRKHLSKGESKFYYRCEILFSLEIIFIWKILGLILPGKFKLKSKTKIDTMKLFIKTWKKEIKKL